MAQTHPEYFFAKTLAGEPPLPFSLAKDLADNAGALARKRPWDLLSEEQLVFVEDPDSPHPHVCLIIGGNGESFGLLAFIGPSAFSYIYNLQNDAETGPERYLANNRSVTVEFCDRAQLEPADLSLLKSVGFKTVRNPLLPKFRSVRPAYLPWFVNETEGRILSVCVSAMLHLLADRSPGELFELWPRERVYPLISPARDYAVTAITREVPPQEMPSPAPVDRERLKKIIDRGLRSAGEMEIAFIHLPIPIGERDERKKVMRLALAADSATGMVYPPEAIDVSVTEGEGMVSCVLTAIETSKVIPATIYVRTSTHKAILSPLAAALGTDLKVRHDLPAVDEAAAAMLQHLTR